MELNAYNGNPQTYYVFDITDDKIFDQNDAMVYSQNGQSVSVPPSGLKSSVGLIATPAVLNAGGIEYKYLPGTSGDIQKITENPGNNRFGRQSWRQLQ